MEQVLYIKVKRVGSYVKKTRLLCQLHYQNIGLVLPAVKLYMQQINIGNYRGAYPYLMEQY
jgi:hypothetical protein